MSKILLIGDSHISLGFPNTFNKWFKVHQEYFDKFLIPLVEKELTSDDIVVHLGDLFDNRSVVPIDALNYAQDVIEKISKICPFHIIIGNHDLHTRSTSEINSIRPFRFMPNVFVYDKPKVIKFNNRSILMLPYIEKRKDQIEVLKKFSGCDYLFCHSDLNGAKMHLSSVAHKNLDKIDVEEFSGYKNVYSGHIHILQRNTNFTFVGNNFEMDRNDLGNQKGIFILDVIEGTERFVPNEVSPRFRKVYIKREDDIEILDGVSTKDYIDLFISNSLLINNRKLRRKLEGMLETGNFASVEYLDDISIERDEKMKELGIEDVTDEDLENGVVPTIQLEYTEMIRDYIGNSKYDSDKIKNGVLQEFNEVVRIYDESYQSVNE